MTNLYSGLSASTSSRAPFTRHQVHEVATSLTQSKQIANDLAETERYQYRATATLLGNVDLAPYDAVYLDNLPGGMTGYWTVLRVRHIFGTSISYKCEVDLGTDLLGQGTPPPVGYRDVEAELANPTTAPQSVYVSNVFLPELGDEFTPYGLTRPTAVSTSLTETVPNFSIIRQQAAWRSQ